MNAVRPVPMTAERAVTFMAWRGNQPVEATNLLDLALTFEEAAGVAAMGAKHKDFVSILRLDAGKARNVVRFYTAKKSTKRGHWREALDGGPKVFEGKIELYQVGEVEVDAYAPTRPFDAMRDDPVGRDLTLVES